MVTSCHWTNINIDRTEVNWIGSRNPQRIQQLLSTLDMHYAFCRQCEKFFFMFRATTHKSTLMTWHAISLWYFDMKNLWYVAHTIRIASCPLSDYKRPVWTRHMMHVCWGWQVGGDIIHTIVRCVCVQADFGHDNDDDECFHFAVACFGRWETPVDDDTWYFHWFFISCAVIILNCVNQGKAVSALCSHKS